MKVRLKICGMKDSKNILEVAGLLPDYMGFIFYRLSPRFVGDGFKVPNLNRRIKRVGVFVNEEVATICALSREHSLDFIQLHGEESPGTCLQLKEMGLGVIKAFSVDEGFSFSSINNYGGAVNYILFDAKGKHYGGNAVPFNWKRLGDYDQRIPFFLSGGIGLDNIERVEDLKNLNLYAVDVNSGAEVKPGLKDITKVQQVKNILDNFKPEPLSDKKFSVI